VCVQLSQCKIFRKASLSEKDLQSLNDVAETLLIPLYIRAIETQRRDALLKDEQAVALVRQMDYDFSRVLIDTRPESQVAVILRNREFDHYARDFLRRFTEAVVVHIGCGLDARFERVDNGRVEWYDLDLPEVIELRRKLIGGEGVRHHFLACSVLDSAWLNGMNVHRQRPFLFLAEGVLMYFEEAQVKSLVLTLKEHFPGAELAFDAFSPFFSWANNIRVTRTKIGARSHWALKHSQDLERWGDGICLLDEFYPFRCPEPRLGQALWVRHIPFFSKTLGVFHYRLGKR
jgi:O-methyltransferase involved in polyketide biosynthesis